MYVLLKQKKLTMLQRRSLKSLIHSSVSVSVSDKISGSVSVSVSDKTYLNPTLILKREKESKWTPCLGEMDSFGLPIWSILDRSMIPNTP